MENMNNDWFKPMEVWDRIQINGIWYVKENTEEKLKSIKLDPVDSQVCSVENDDFAFKAIRLLKEDGTPYGLYVSGLNSIDIESTDKRSTPWKIEHWDNDHWMRGVLENNPDSWKDLPDMGSDNIMFLQAFLQHLVNKGWL